MPRIPVCSFSSVSVFCCFQSCLAPSASAQVRNRIAQNIADIEPPLSGPHPMARAGLIRGRVKAA